MAQNNPEEIVGTGEYPFPCFAKHMEDFQIISMCLYAPGIGDLSGIPSTMSCLKPVWDEWSRLIPELVTVQLKPL